MAFNRDSSLDISLGSGAWSGGASDGTTLWFVDNTADEARAYVAATQARDSGKDIDLGTGAWQGGLSDGTTLWFVDTTGDDTRGLTWPRLKREIQLRTSTLARDTWVGGLSDGTTLWLVHTTSNDRAGLRGRYSSAGFR